MPGVQICAKKIWKKKTIFSLTFTWQEQLMLGCYVILSTGLLVNKHKIVQKEG